MGTPTKLQCLQTLLSGKSNDRSVEKVLVVLVVLLNPCADEGPASFTSITLQFAEGEKASTSADNEAFGGDCPAGPKV